MMSKTIISLVFVAVVAAVPWNNKCNQQFNMDNTAFLEQGLGAVGYTPSGTGAVLPRACLTFFKPTAANKGRKVVLKTSALAPVMTTLQSQLCASGYAGIAFFDGETKKVDYCVGACTGTFTSTFDNAEHELTNALVRTYVSCPSITFAPIVQYKLL